MTWKHLPQDFLGIFMQRQDFQPNAQRSLRCFIQMVKDTGPYNAFKDLFPVINPSCCPVSIYLVVQCLLSL